MKKIILIVVSVVFMLGMAGLMIYFITKKDTFRWGIALCGIILSALPLGLLWLKNNPINTPSIIGYYAFLFFSIFLGSIGSFYDRFVWWDIAVHFYKGGFVACVGITLYKIFIPEQARRGVSVWIPVLFVLGLAVVSSIIWEFYEFMGDVIASHTMQRGGNTDTMYDLLAGFTGGLLIAIYTSIRKQHV
ncbi:hypothetical protein [Heyndrickxia acidiproducens]|uniref:hypothetical protein n=1 Tax=Heyndrickxia acidiproducens TaxID=1121084 RepID=UPI00037C0A4B|nr:hypothetical protein [Heyndrickxia acidiproducens]